MAVKTVAYIRPVRNTLNDPVLLSELIYLLTAQAFSRSPVNSVQVPVFLLKGIYAVIDEFKRS